METAELEKPPSPGFSGLSASAISLLNDIIYIAFTFSHDTALPNPSWTVGCSIEVQTEILIFVEKSFDLPPGEAARVHGGNAAAEVFLRRALGRWREPQPAEHKTCFLPHCAWDHSRPRSRQQEELPQPWKMAG